jgi:hypothetical protein
MSKRRTREHRDQPSLLQPRTAKAAPVRLKPPQAPPRRLAHKHGSDRPKPVRLGAALSSLPRRQVLSKPHDLNGLLLPTGRALPLLSRRPNSRQTRPPTLLPIRQRSDDRVLPKALLTRLGSHTPDQSSNAKAAHGNTRRDRTASFRQPLVAAATRERLTTRRTSDASKGSGTARFSSGARDHRNANRRARQRRITEDAQVKAVIPGP